MGHVIDMRTRERLRQTGVWRTFKVTTHNPTGGPPFCCSYRAQSASSAYQRARRDGHKFIISVSEESNQP
jgi:hypothetical protein